MRYDNRMDSQSADKERLDQTVRRILGLLNELTPDNLELVEQLVERLRTVNPSQLAAYTFPTITTPASSLVSLTGLLGEGYQGDALNDSEAIYDDQ